MNGTLRDRFDFSCISRSRGVFFGIAALWVALFHSDYLSFEFLRFHPLVVLFNYLKIYGNMGVEIFILFSGLGLYYSLSNDGSVSAFYRKRFWRVIPSVWIVAVIWCGLAYENIGILAFLSKITLLELFINGNRDFWFFSLILLLYLIYPAIHRFIREKTLPRLLILLICSVLFNIALYAIVPGYFYMVEVATIRIPIFFVGIAFGYLSKNGRTIPLPYLLAAFFVMAFGFIALNFKNDFLYERILYSLIVIPMVMVFSWIFDHVSLPRTKKVLVGLGRYSMEIYLLYQLVIAGLLERVRLDEYYLGFYLVSFVVTLVLAALLKMAVSALSAAFGAVKTDPAN